MENAADDCSVGHHDWSLERINKGFVATVGILSNPQPLESFFSTEQLDKISKASQELLSSLRLKTAPRLDRGPSKRAARPTTRIAVPSPAAPAVVKVESEASELPQKEATLKQRSASKKKRPAEKKAKEPRAKKAKTSKSVKKPSAPAANEDAEQQADAAVYEAMLRHHKQIKKKLQKIHKILPEVPDSSQPIALPGIDKGLSLLPAASSSVSRRPTLTKSKKAAPRKVPSAKTRTAQSNEDKLQPPFLKSPTAMFINPHNYLFPYPLLRPSDSNGWVDVDCNPLLHLNLFMAEGGCFQERKDILDPEAHLHKLHREHMQKKKLCDQVEHTKRLWNVIVRRDIPKAHKAFNSTHSTLVNNAKKLALLCQKEVKRRLGKVMRGTRDRAKKLAREMVTYWKKSEKEEREAKKRADKEMMEMRKREEEIREAKRQQKKLNFLLTQTELYSHFIGRKMGMTDTDLPSNLDQNTTDAPKEGESSVVNIDDDDNEDEESLKQRALEGANQALQKQMQSAREFENEMSKLRNQHAGKPGKNGGGEPTWSTPSSMPSENTIAQPTMFRGTLKEYQLKGVNWLINLYDQGINGILADEMGLGKTIQSISCMAHLAEEKNIWGPFLVVAPTSTLYNWLNEFEKFTPQLKILPYWGSQKERAIIRKDWNPKKLYTKNSPFHVLITSYNLVVLDEKYFHRIRWEFMTLDEAQCVKSSSSARWKTLLNFKCRNRLLLTGTPIQNSMAELWALLHFIMPTLFDSHEEFNEWFSKDIESHAGGANSKLNEHQLSRLHMILKPFMLRRVKKDVENELAEKIEIEVPCYLTSRQQKLYRGIKAKITIAELLSNSSDMDHLMNLVMQFRKVCNHPEIFERREVSSPFTFINSSFGNGTNPIQFEVPRLLYLEGMSDPFGGGSVSAIAAKMLLRQKMQVFSPSVVASLLHHQDVPSTHSITRFADMSPADVQQMALLSSLPLALRTAADVIPRRQRVAEQHVLSTSSGPWPRSHMLLEPSLRAPASVLRLLQLTDLVPESVDTVSHRTGVIVDKCAGLYSPAVQAVPILQVCSNAGFAHRSHYQAHHFPTQQLLLGTLPVSSEPMPLSCLHDHPFGLPATAQALLPQKDVPSTGLVTSLTAAHRLSHISIPNMSRLISDSGKLVVLDSLLKRLKSEGHRVLIYSQMTKMIDILEDYMAYRGYAHIRLDGSSKLSDRRDLVDSFQSSDRIFAFLLSTRAGGLGINLTAADTVIFYDSDWNPTIDAQAMDRAHRLGQTKQVTVFRFVTKNTIEERILNRAKQKNTIQSIVISGGKFKPESFKPQEVMSLLLDDNELEKNLQKVEDERNQKKRGRRGGLASLSSVAGAAKEPRATKRRASNAGPPNAKRQKKPTGGKMSEPSTPAGGTTPTGRLTPAP